jgi:hypothetical protein
MIREDRQVDIGKEEVGIFSYGKRWFALGTNTSLLQCSPSHPNISMLSCSRQHPLSIFFFDALGLVVIVSTVETWQPLKLVLCEDRKFDSHLSFTPPRPPVSDPTSPCCLVSVTPSFFFFEG